jgi:hypothetical protein
MSTRARDAAHGTPGNTESVDDLERMQQLTDYLTFRVEGLDADGFIGELDALAHQLDPGWWQVRRSIQ